MHYSYSLKVTEPSICQIFWVNTALIKHAWSGDIKVFVFKQIILNQYVTVNLMFIWFYIYPKNKQASEFSY